MPKKIKKLIPHDCTKHWVTVSPIFLGYEEHKLAILEKEKYKARWGALVQCARCMRVAVLDIAKKEEDDTTGKDEKTKGV